MTTALAPAPATHTTNVPSTEVNPTLVWLTRMLDDAYRIPGTPVRFGWDSIVGLIPGAGDLITAAVSVVMLKEAARLGVSRVTRARMVGNCLIDLVIGAVPLVGDVADLAFKANRKNLRLLEAHCNQRNRIERMSARRRNQH